MTTEEISRQLCYVVSYEILKPIVNHFCCVEWEWVNADFGESVSLTPFIPILQRSYLETSFE